MASQLPEPWMRGPIPGVSPFVAPLLYSFQMAREDLATHTEGLTTEQIWLRPEGAAPVAFHIRHIGGSVERLMTYALGGQLNESQLAELRAELEPGASLDHLLAGMDRRLAWAESAARSIPVESLAEPRAVGRRALPATVIGLLVHIAEHTQRHVGQAITTARMVRGR